MSKLTSVAVALSAVIIAIGVSGASSAPAKLTCVQTDSSRRQSCNDAGGYASTCAFAKCPDGYTLTGGGGICAAGNRKVKGLNPSLSTGKFFIMCEQQSVDPQARAICCKL